MTSPFTVPHEAFALDNGLQVVLIPDRRLPKAVVDLWYDVGSFDDPWTKSGFAHLFEHLMFKGTKDVPEGEFDRHMEAVGASNNASTADERTNYYDQGPSSNLELLLCLEADRMTGLHITQKKLDIEREVVRNERRQNYEDAPYGAVWLALPQMLFGADHPMSRSGIGTHEELVAASLDDVRAFYETWYVPSNAVLAVAGDFDVDAVTQTIRATFGALPSRKKPSRTRMPWPDRPVQPFLQLQDDVALAATFHAWHSPAYFSDGDAAFDVLCGVLTGSEDGRLQRRLVHGDGSAQDVDAQQLSGRWGSVFAISAHASPGFELPNVDAAIEAELAALGSDRPPTVDEVQRAANNLEMSRLYGAESLLGRAEMLQTWRMHLGRYDALQQDVERYRAVTVADVIAAARRLTPDRRALLHVVPAGDAS